MNIVDVDLKECKELLKQGFDRNVCKFKILFAHEEEIDIHIATTKYIYRIFVNRKIETSTARGKFNIEFGQDDLWCNIYTLPYRCSNEIRMHNTSIQNSLNSLRTHSRLYKMKIVDTNQCSYCETEIETMQHLLFDCTKANSIWDTFKWRNH